MSLIGNAVAFIIWIYLMVLTVRAVLSLIPLFVRDWQPRGVILVIAEFVYTLTDPPVAIPAALHSAAADRWHAVGCRIPGSLPGPLIP